MPVASTLNKESKADSAMWGCLILWSYQKDESITALLKMPKISRVLQTLINHSQKDLNSGHSLMML